MPVYCLSRFILLWLGLLLTWPVLANQTLANRMLDVRKVEGLDVYYNLSNGLPLQGADAVHGAARRVGQGRSGVHEATVCAHQECRAALAWASATSAISWSSACIDHSS